MRLQRKRWGGRIVSRWAPRTLIVNEILTRAEIEARFPNEWILMVDPDPAVDVNFRGLVVAHSKDRYELYEKSKEYRPRTIVVFFAGPPFPPGMQVLL